MANLVITSSCPAGCSYCFTRGALAGAPRYMDRPTFARCLDLLEASGIDEARLLGGEPGEHPELAGLVTEALGRGLKVLVFTNGLLADRVLDSLPADGRLGFLVNATLPATADRRRQGQVLARLGPRARFGATISAPGQRLEWMAALIRRHRLQPVIRLGLAHPPSDGSGGWLRPRHYPAVGSMVTELARAARSDGITVELDCGFVPCMFPGDAEDVLGPAVAEVGTRCNPVLDLLADGTVVACFPLAGLARVRLDAAAGAASLRRRLARDLRPLRALGIYPSCASCPARAAGRCTGGCVAVAHRRLRGAPEVRSESLGAGRRPSRGRATPAPPRRARPWVLPYIDQPLAFWETVVERAGELLHEVYVPLEVRGLGSGRPEQPRRHLEALLRGRLLPVAALVNPIALPAPLEQVTQRVVAALRRWHEEHGVTSVTVCDLALARRIRASLPAMTITASVLMDVWRTEEARAAAEVCDVLVPSSRIMRDLPTLLTVGDAFAGRLRLLVNEACLPGCADRRRHFVAMAGEDLPGTPCEQRLAAEPWRRLTGSWVLPQHLHLYAVVADEYKLAGRVTLQDPERYLRVVEAYLGGDRLGPHEIGGGPASVLEPVAVTEELFATTQWCGQRCDGCMICRETYAAARSGRA